VTLRITSEPLRAGKRPKLYSAASACMKRPVKAKIHYTSFPVADL